MENDKLQSFGVFKPVGHVLISFPSEAAATRGQEALRELRVSDSEVHRFSDREMLAQIDADLEDASPLAALGQELNLVKAQRALAEQGYHWLMVRTDDRDAAVRIAEAAHAAGAERAQRYGRFIIEELIEHREDLTQVSESPDRGLDAQTPQGKEEERADLRPASSAPAAPGGKKR